MDTKKVIALFVALLLIVILYGVLGNQTGEVSESEDLRNVQYSSGNDTILANVNSAQSLSQTPSSFTSATALNQTWLEFDGVDDSLITTDASLLNDSESFTILVNVMPNEDEDRGTIVNKYTPWGFDLRSDGTDAGYTFCLINQSGTEVCKVLFDVIGNEKTFLAGSLNNGYNEFFMKGDKINLQRGGTSAFVGGVRSGGTVRFGNSGAGHIFNGSIYDIKIVNLSFTQADKNKVFYNNKTLVPVFIYHSFCDPTTSSLCVNETIFRSHMNILNNSGYQTITDVEYYNWTQGLISIEEKSFILTFDDANDGVILNFTPIMNEYNYFGIMVINTDAIGSANKLSWENVSSLIIKNWSVASHSDAHCHLGFGVGGTAPTWCNSTVNRIGNLSLSKQKIIDNTGFTPITFFYPYSDWGNQNSTDLEYYALHPEVMNDCLDYYKMCGASDYQFDNARYWIDNFNVSRGDLGRILVNNITTADDFLNVLNYTNYLNMEDNLLLKYNLNENQGTTAYDVSGNANNGTITGATWANDGVDVSLTRDTDYSVSGTTFTILNSEFAWSQLIASYQYKSLDETFGFHVTIIRILTGFVGLAVLTFAVLVLFIILRGNRIT